MTRNQARQLLLAIQELVAAEIANSRKGGGHPEDIPEIEETVADARNLVTKLVTEQVK